MKIVIRNDEKKDKGVSAIIGTILIVAITVVLAATLYAVLGGFTGLIHGTAPTGAITVSSSSVGATGESYSITFSSLSNNVSVGNIAISLTSGGSSVTVTGFSSSTLSKTSTSIGSPATTFNVTISSLNSAHDLNIGSVITITASSGTAALSSISILDTNPSGTIATASNL
jgi:flagellin-like protein